MSNFQTYGIVEYAKPALDEWQTNDVDLDKWYALAGRCVKASRLGLLDWYLDDGRVNAESFTEFLLKFADEVKNRKDVPFELVDDTIPAGLVDAEIEDCLLYTYWISDTKKSIADAFAALKNAGRTCSERVLETPV